MWRLNFNTTPAILLVARLLGAGVAFCGQLLLARALTAEDLGTFYAAASLAAIGGLICAQGYPGISARFVSRYTQRNRPAHLQAFLTQATREAFWAAALSAAAVAMVAFCWPDVALEQRIAFALAGLGIPACTSIGLFGAFAGAVRQFLNSLLPELLIRPLLFLLVIAALFQTRPTMTGAEAILVLGAVTACVALVQWRLVSRALPSARAERAVPLAKRWRREAWPLIPVMLFTGLFADLAILVESAFLDGVDLAAFSICMKLALIVGFAVQMAHQVAIPDIADAYALRQLGHIRRRLLRAALFPISVCMSALLFVHTFGDEILQAFGNEFVYAQGILELLVGCQLLRALAGPSTSLLTLEGAQRSNAMICGLACVVLVSASALLVPFHGIWGAAFAVTATYIFWTGAAGILLYSTSRIRTDLLGIVKQPTARI